MDEPIRYQPSPENLLFLNHGRQRMNSLNDAYNLSKNKQIGTMNNSIHSGSGGPNYPTHMKVSYNGSPLNENVLF